MVNLVVSVNSIHFDSDTVQRLYSFFEIYASFNSHSSNNKSAHVLKIHELSTYLHEYEDVHKFLKSSKSVQIDLLGSSAHCPSLFHAHYVSSLTSPPQSFSTLILLQTRAIQPVSVVIHP